MPRSRFLSAALVLLVPLACAQPVRVSSQDVTLNTRWHANLASPASMAGVVQMRGSASMAPSESATSTTITLNLGNASPGGLHPWAVHYGQCGDGMDEGVFGAGDAYKALEVQADGNAAGTATVTVVTPRTGSYFAVVRASVQNPEMIVACGNLAPPTQ